MVIQKVRSPCHGKPVQRASSNNHVSLDLRNGLLVKVKVLGHVPLDPSEFPLEHVNGRKHVLFPSLDDVGDSIDVAAQARLGEKSIRGAGAPLLVAVQVVERVLLGDSRGIAAREEHDQHCSNPGAVFACCAVHEDGSGRLLGKMLEDWAEGMGAASEGVLVCFSIALEIVSVNELQQR